MSCRDNRVPIKEVMHPIVGGIQSLGDLRRLEIFSGHVRMSRQAVAQFQ